MPTDATTATGPEVVVLPDHARRAFGDDGPRPVRVHVRRAARDDAPLVVLSHGAGGAAADLDWWARALCDSGLDVAAVDHHGNTWAEPRYAAESFAWWWDRPLDVSLVLDRVEARGPVGVAGYSLGGWTAAAVCGARIAEAGYLALVGGGADGPPAPEYPGLRDELAARYGEDVGPQWAQRAAADLRDPRVVAGFWLCPSLGPLVDPASLARIDVPVAVRWTAADTSAPPERNGALYARLVPGADGGTVGAPESGHYGLVSADAPDGPARAGTVHDSVAFFCRTLARPAG